MAYRIFKRKRYILGIILAVLVIALIAARLYLDTWLLNYVNRSLANIKGYHGSVESISIHLYRGAYTIHNLKITKNTGNIPTPFIDIAQTDLSIQWGALFHGRIVSNIDLDRPVLNFAVSPSGNTKQTGTEVDWNKPIRDLMPIDINLVTFKNGKLTYRDFSASPKVNLYIHEMRGELRNLRNVVDESKPLPSSLLVTGESIGKGRLTIDGHMNILKPVPDMDLDAQLENANLTAINDFTQDAAAIEIKSGKLSVYSELIVKNNHLTGYIKPIATNVSLISLSKSDNPIQLLWETAVAVVVEIFTNQKTDQFATRIPLEGNLDKIDTPTWPAIVAIVQNAFVSAFKKSVDGSVKY